MKLEYQYSCVVLCINCGYTGHMYVPQAQKVSDAECSNCHCLQVLRCVVAHVVADHLPVRSDSTFHDTSLN